MSPKPHSQTVRGTLDHPKIQEAMNSDKPIPRPGDPISLNPETDSNRLSPNDIDPPPRQGWTSSSESAHTVSDSFREKEGHSLIDKEAKGNERQERQDLPHSKKVRGTLANSDGKKANRAQLGDPVSLKAETSKTTMVKDVEREGQSKSGKSKL